jgi:hypothetical protein
MFTTKENFEYRRHRRLKAKKGAVAVLCGRYYKIGPVIDITWGGLAFRYTYDDEKNLETACRLSIFFTGEDFYLRMVPVKIVYEIEENSETPITTPRMKRCGVKFGRLTECQRPMLKQFIRNYTVGEIHALWAGSEFKGFAN